MLLEHEIWGGYFKIFYFILFKMLAVTFISKAIKFKVTCA